MRCILKFRSLNKISVETLELYFRGEEKTKISREASWDIWNSQLDLSFIQSVSFHRRVACQKRKSLFFSGLFWQNKVGEIHRHFVGVFNRTINPLVIVGYEMIIECFYMTSLWPYWCPKTMKWRPCWCPKPILWELNSFRMQTLSFVPRQDKTMVYLESYTVLCISTLSK